MTLAERVLALVRELEQQYEVWQAVAEDSKQSRAARDRAADLARVNRMHARWLRVVLDPNPDPIEYASYQGPVIRWGTPVRERPRASIFGGTGWEELLARMAPEAVSLAQRQEAPSPGGCDEQGTDPQAE